MSTKHQGKIYVALAVISGVIFLYFSRDNASEIEKKTLAATTPQKIINKIEPPLRLNSESSTSAQHASSSSQPEHASAATTSASENFSSTSSSSSKHPFVPRNWMSAREHKDPSLKKYSAQIPRLFSDSSMFAKGARYLGMTMEWYHQKMLEGDVAAKFYYSNNLMLSISKEFHQDYLLKGDMVDVAYWRRRLEEPEKLMIECATQGIVAAAANLPLMYTNAKLRDPIDAMAWALITDAMSPERDIFLTMNCLDPEWGSECTDANLTAATERALMMIDLYGFKIITNKKNP